ncbi:MAG: methyltransferase domain-containing protein [Candidatus Vogelbacteria bacterium]|nr:methyltransferase domain-containing protein [Candidatus Vogelbacteria bacterium]
MAFADPKENLINLDIKDGWKVADFGTGSGHYALELARRVGESGRIYAVDVQKDLLTRLKNKARDEHLSNLEVVWADIDEVGGTKLADSSLDAVIISNVLFQSENKANLTKESARILRSGGEVMVIDWADSYGGLGPQPNQIFKASDAESLFVKNSFVLIKSFDAGEHHWGLMFKKL